MSRPDCGRGILTDIGRGKINSAVKILRWKFQTYAMHYLRIVIILLFALVILICARESSAHDVQKQQSEDIAIHDKNDFWQPPSEPGK
jgi:hypothetical protein